MVKEETSKVGWYLNKHVVESITKLANKSDSKFVSEIANRALAIGLSSDIMNTAVERNYWAEKSIFSTVETLLKVESQVSNGSLKDDFKTLLISISSYRQVKSCKYGLYIMDLNNILDMSKKQCPDTYFIFIRILKKFNTIYKDICDVEPCHRAVFNGSIINNYNSIKTFKEPENNNLTEDQYIKQGKMRK